MLSLKTNKNPQPAYQKKKKSTHQKNRFNRAVVKAAIKNTDKQFCNNQIMVKPVLVLSHGSHLNERIAKNIHPIAKNGEEALSQCPFLPLWSLAVDCMLPPGIGTF